MTISSRAAQFVNVLMRVTGLAAKLGLTLYMGRYLPLADIGAYGLVFGMVMVLSRAVGFYLEYTASRQLVGLNAEAALFRMRDQALFYFLSFIAIAACAAALFAAGALGLSGRLLAYALMLSLGEGLSSMNYANMISRDLPLRANIVFFVRSSLWVFFAVFLGLASPAFRNADTVLTSWVAGVAASLVLTVWIWPGIPWRQVLRRPVDWRWIGDGVKQCVPVWLGQVGLTLGSAIDRFVTMHFLGLDYVGAATFYLSFANALTAIAQSGVFAFANPRLIELHRADDKKGFAAKARHTAGEAALSGGILALLCGAGVSLLAPWLHRPLLVEALPAFRLMLFAAWLRINADTLYYILFARHQDRAIWLGNLLYLLPAFGLNALFVPAFGLMGIGYSGIVATLALLVWRWIEADAGQLYKSPTRAAP